MRSGSLSVGLALLAGLVPGALAQWSGTVIPHDSYGDTNGGEFLLEYANLPFTPVNLSGAEAGRFETFCVEKNEYIQLGATYYVRVATEAAHGGVGGGSPDPLDSLTAYLYSQFITGGLDGYVYDAGGNLSGRIASANALQHVIWYIEQEEDKVWSDGDLSLMDKFYQDALAHAPSGIGDVRILNLFADPEGGSYAQDELVMTPEPGGLVLLGVGVGSLLYGRRRS